MYNIMLNTMIKTIVNYPLHGLLWLIIFICLLIIEAIIKNSVALWFSVSAILCFILTTFETKLIYQVLFFILFSDLLLVIYHWNYIKKQVFNLRDKIDEAIKSPNEK